MTGKRSASLRSRVVTSTGICGMARPQGNQGSSRWRLPLSSHTALSAVLIIQSAMRDFDRAHSASSMNDSSMNRNDAGRGVLINDAALHHKHYAPDGRD